MVTSTEERKRTIIRTSWGFFANSVMAAALAVVLARIIEQFGIALFGAIVDRSPVLTNVVTLLRTDGSDLAYLGAPLASLAAGVFFLMIYPGAKDRSAGKLMVLWLILFSFRNGFVDLAIVTVSPDSYTARALQHVDLPAGLDVVLAVTGIMGLLLVAMAAAGAFLGFNRHHSEVSTPAERVRYVSSLALLPAIVGPLLAVPFLLPDQGTGYLATLPLLGIFIIVTVLAAPRTKNFLAPQLAEDRTLSLGMIISLFVVFLVVRFVLEPGIQIPPWDADFQWHFRP